MTIDNTDEPNFLHDFQIIVLTNVLRQGITYYNTPPEPPESLLQNP